MAKPQTPMIPPPAKKLRDRKAPPPKPIPAIARTAIALAASNYQRQMEELALQVLASMGLSQKEGWRVFIEEGVVRKVDQAT